jgi:hypothetical protein
MERGFVSRCLAPLSNEISARKRHPNMERGSACPLAISSPCLTPRIPNQHLHKTNRTRIRASCGNTSRAPCKLLPHRYKLPYKLVNFQNHLARQFANHFCPYFSPTTQRGRVFFQAASISRLIHFSIFPKGAHSSAIHTDLKQTDPVIVTPHDLLFTPSMGTLSARNFLFHLLREIP